MSTLATPPPDASLSDLVDGLTIADGDRVQLSASRKAVPTSTGELRSLTVTLNGKSPLQTGASSSYEAAEKDETANQVQLQERIESLSREVSRILDHIFEIQELRYETSSTSTTAADPTHSSRLDDLLSRLDKSVASLEPQIEQVNATIQDVAVAQVAPLQDNYSELAGSWAKARKQYRMVKEEMKEDGWLIRFRTTSDQAEAMINTIQKSLVDCSRYIERISTSPVPVPYDCELEELPSIRRLQTIAKGHESMRNTYVPSIIKILNMIDKSITDRPFKNGEALRRYGEMYARWSSIQKQLSQLDARVRIIVSQHQHADPDVEILVDEGDSASVTGASSYFAGYEDERKAGNHRSSISSGTTSSSRQSRDSLAPDGALRSALKKRPSMMSTTSNGTARTSDKPPWNAFPKPASETDRLRTPTSLRVSSYGYGDRAVSPTPSTASRPRSSMGMVKPGVSGSRIPVISPKSRRFPSGDGRTSMGGQMEIPTLAVSTSHTHHFLSDDPSLTTPHRARPRLSATQSTYQPRSSLTPSLGQRTVSSTTPRTAPQPRQSLFRAPPSSYRSTTPTPSVRTTMRPSSRMSITSHAIPQSTLNPFQPSKYDLLDDHVQFILDEVNWGNIFVSRVDASMKKGQRRRDDEEWKGEFVFGAGEKVNPVKILKIAGRTGMGEGERVRVLVKSGGAWVDLRGFLEGRREAILGVGVGSP